MQSHQILSFVFFNMIVRINCPNSFNFYYSFLYFKSLWNEVFTSDISRLQILMGFYRNQSQASGVGSQVTSPRYPCVHPSHPQSCQDHPGGKVTFFLVIVLAKVIQQFYCLNFTWQFTIHTWYNWQFTYILLYFALFPVFYITQILCRKYFNKLLILPDFFIS